MKKILASIACLFLIVIACAQDSTGTKTNSMKENWDSGIVNTLKQSGGLYGVIAVIAIILAGLFYYLFRLEKKINRLEKQQKS